MRVIDLVNELSELLEVDKFIDYCQNGLQIGNYDQHITKIATAVSCDIETINKAIDEKVNVLIVHHGIFWNGDSFEISGSKKNKIELLLKNNISLLAYHLPLDANKSIGNNWSVANMLNWNRCEIFGSKKLPIGVSGFFDPQDISEFITSLSDIYGRKPMASVLAGKKTVRSAAIMSGGAYKEISLAIQKNVDCFITGNFDEPVWSIAKEEQIHFLAFGHYATETIGPIELKKHIESTYNIESVFIQTKNPF